MVKDRQMPPRKWIRAGIWRVTGGFERLQVGNHLRLAVDASVRQRKEVPNGIERLALRIQQRIRRAGDRIELRRLYKPLERMVNDHLAQRVLDGLALQDARIVEVGWTGQGNAHQCRRP